MADKTGNLYGTTKNFDVGCIHGCGVIVKLAPPKYSPTQIYKFTGGADGGDPDSLTTHYRADGALILYGATRQGGGLANAGTVFAFEPGTRALTTLYAFAGGADGGGFGDVVYRNGALYGATLTGGRARLGAVFRLEPAKGQTVWKKTVLHAFTGGADGGYPLMGAFDAGGALYGVTAVGGNLVNCPADGAFPAGCGTAFKIAP